MKHSTVATASLLELLAGTVVVTNAGWDQIKIKDNGINFKVRRFDDGRTKPYRLIFRTTDTSSYKIRSDGRVTYFKAGSEKYKVKYRGNGNIREVIRKDNGARMLLADDLNNDIFEMEELLDEGIPAEGIFSTEHRRLTYACDDCEEAWEVVCGPALSYICQLVGNEIMGTVGSQSVDTACVQFGSLCGSLSAVEACDGECIEDVTPQPTPAPTTPSPVTPAPTTPAPVTPAPTTPAPVTPAPTTPAPVTPAPTTPAPVGEGSCAPNPCQNGGVCIVDSAGGHLCDCASGYGGMACQTSTSSLAEFYIEVDFQGTWTDARQAVFQVAADRWAEIITNVPCGGNNDYPAGRLLISATLETIDGSGGVLGSAGPSHIWNSCPTISLLGSMRFDIDDISDMETAGTFESVILHEMGHVIGVGTLWGDCSTCRIDGDSNWKCPAVIEVYNDLLGNPGDNESDLIELDGSTGTACGHFDEDIFGDELMTGYISNHETPLSKVTAASLDDTGYIVDPSMVDDYTLPAFLIQVRHEAGYHATDYSVDTTIDVVDDNGEVIDQVDGIMMYF